MKRVTSHPLFRTKFWIGLGLLLIDAFFIAAEMMQRQYRHYGRFPAFAHPGWRADPDGSFAEIWGYAKSIAAACLLVFLFLRHRRATVLLGAALLFVVVALDDMLQFHERGGGFLANNLGLPSMFGLRAQDLGELIVWALLGIPLVLLILVGYLRSDPLPRRITLTLVPPFVALLFFAVAVDLFLIIALELGWPGRPVYLVQLTETVGELVSFTAILLVPVYFVLRHHTARGRALDEPEPGAS